MGVHALAGVATIGAPVGDGANATTIGVTVPSVSGGLVLDVLYGQNSTTSYTAGAGQTERWDTNTTGGLGNLRGAGSAGERGPLGGDDLDRGLAGEHGPPGGGLRSQCAGAHPAGGPEPDQRHRR